MNSDYTAMELELTRLLKALDGVFTSSEIAEVEQFLKAGEYGVAFETLCGIAKEENRSIPTELRPAVRALAQRMGIESLWWSEIV